MRIAIEFGVALTLAAAVCLVGAVPVGAQEPFEGARALATIGGETITVAEFEREMARRSLVPGQFADPAHRGELLDEMVRLKVLEMAARREGYAEHPDVQKVLRKAIVSKYVDDRLDALLAEAAVTEEEIERHYRENASEYQIPGRARGAIILIAVPEKVAPEKLAELEKKANQIREKAVGTDDREFAALARRHSDDSASRYVGGGIGWVTGAGRTLKWGDQVVETLLTLKTPGEVGPVVRGEAGYYIVRLAENEEAKPLPIEQLRAGIAHRLLKERRERLRTDFYTGLYEDLKVARNDELLDSLEAPAGNRGLPQPPPLPGKVIDSEEPSAAVSAAGKSAYEGRDEGGS